MIIIHSMTALPRLAAPALTHAAGVMPVIVVTGARQTGKTTLVRDIAPTGERPYFTLDDLDVLEQAGRAPDDLVGRAARRIGREDWQALARRGGYPVPALDLNSDDARATWFAGYVQTYLERDLRDLSVVTSLPDVRRLMRAICLRLGQLLNQTELGRDVALPQPTVHRWLNLLETSYQLVRVPAYAVNRTKRVIKTPKVYWADTGLALHVAGLAEPGGPHLENLVLSDLLAWRDVRLDRPDVLYWRTATGEESDFVIEAGRTLLPIEVKSTARPRPDDAKHLLVFREEYRRRCRPGLLVHTGDAIEWLAAGVL